MSGSFGFAARRRWRSNFVSRALIRSFIGSFAAIPMVAALIVPCNEPHGEDTAAVCLAVAAGGAVLLIFVWRWFGKGRILWGLWLWLLSYGLWNGIVALVSVAGGWIGSSRGAAVDENSLLVMAVIGVALTVLCSMGLRRFDPD
jgi:hypothetical protein